MRVLVYPPFHHEATNAYQFLLYSELARLGLIVEDFSVAAVLRGGSQLLHLHWPERGLNDPRPLVAALRSAGLLGLMAVARRRGTKLVWTAHNLQAHERRYPKLEELFWRLFVRNLDGYVSLSESGTQAAVRRLPQLRKLPTATIPHGHYRGAYPDASSREEIRARFGLEANTAVLVFLGSIRPYKNVPALIRAFRERSEPNAVLLVAGAPLSDSIASEVRAAAGDEPRVRLHLRFIPPAEVHVFFRAADVAIFPYSAVLNSGSALLALSFDCPVVVPATGALPELRDDVGEEWVLTYQGGLSPAVVDEALRFARFTGRKPPAPLESRNWPVIARSTREFYDALGA